MGYFSNLAIEYVPYDHDCSYTSAETELLWRLEDLRDRLRELVAKRRVHEDRVTFSEDKLRYVWPAHFVTVRDVMAAISLVIRDLNDQYGIQLPEEIEEEYPVVDEITGMQISFLDILSAGSQYNSLCAA